jgi:hypothetical protein
MEEVKAKIVSVSAADHATQTDLYVADSQVMAHIRLTAKEAVSPRTDLSL